MKKMLKTLGVMLLSLGIVLGPFSMFEQRVQAATPWNFSYTGSEQTWTAPSSGTYKLEVWGSRGANSTKDGNGGYGGYAYGEKYVSAGETLYICVGGYQSINDNGQYYTYGGGGIGDSGYGGDGGGATDIRTLSGNLYTRIIVAGGGGGGSKYDNGGAGGGNSGGNGDYYTSSFQGGGATQSSGGIGGKSYGDDGGFGWGGDSDFGNGGGGGGGWYGGGGGLGGGGGSGYISGSVTNGGMSSGVNSGTGRATITLMGPTAPTAPTLSASAASSSSISLSWTAVSGATNYYVYTSAGTQVTSTTSTSYTVTGLNASTTYSYYVKAYNGTAYSVASNTASATTQSAGTTTVNGLYITTTLNNVNQDSQIYTAPSGKVITSVTLQGNGETNYDTGSLYYYQSGTWVLAGTAKSGSNWSQTYTMPSGITQIKTHLYTDGSNIITNTYVNASPTLGSLVTVPSTPTGLTIGSATTSSLYASWNSVSGATSYTLYRSTSATGTYSSVYTGTNTYYTNTGLSGYTTYYYKVAASNTAGTSSQSSYVSGTTLSTDTTPPTISASPSSGTLTSGQTVTISVLDTGSGLDRVGYAWDWDGSSPGTVTTFSGQTTTQYVYATAPSTSGSHSLTVSAIDKLTNGVGDHKTYYYTVVTVPSTPTGLSIGSATSTSLYASWNSVSGATSYTLYRATSATGTYSSVYAGANTYYSNTGLTANTTYYYKVVAFNTAGTSSQSSYVSGKTSIATIPVTGVTLTPTTLSIAVGNTSTLTATVSPSNATNKTVTWTSSKPSVATVDSTGKVTAVAVGTATITVTTQDGSKTATCAVTVSSGGESLIIVVPIDNEVNIYVLGEITGASTVTWTVPGQGTVNKGTVTPQTGQGYTIVTVAFDSLGPKYGTIGTSGVSINVVAVEQPTSTTTAQVTFE